MTDVIYAPKAHTDLDDSEACRNERNDPVQPDTFIAGTWSKPDGFSIWETPLALYEHLLTHSRIIGFNTTAFNHVIAHQAGRARALLDVRSFDLLIDLESRLGYPPPLDQLATGLGGVPSDNGRLASECWKALHALTILVDTLSHPQDRWQVIQLGHHFHRRLKHACTADVKLIRDIYHFGQAHGFVYIYHHGRRHKIPVDWHLKEVRQ